MYEPFYDLDKEPSRRLAARICDQQMTIEDMEGFGVDPDGSCRGRAVLAVVLILAALVSVGMVFLLIHWVFA